MTRLTMAERMKTCAVAVPEHFVVYFPEARAVDLPAWSRCALGKDLGHIYECIEPDIIWWIANNIRQKSKIAIKARWVLRGKTTCGFEGINMEGRWFVFGNENDALMFKMGMGQWT